MLSKDHFSNILNEPAGKVASQVLKWVVPQLISCWDDERVDVDRTLTRIIQGVFHHPNLRDFGNDGAVDGRRLMFGVVQEWWGSKDEEERYVLRDQLSRDGVEQGRNHKEGVHDTGHGCGKPLGMPTTKTANSSGALGGLAGGAMLGEISSALAGESKYDAGFTGNAQSSGGGNSSIGKFAEEAVGRGAMGGLVGGIAGALGGDLLGDVFGGSESEKKTCASQAYEEDGSYTQSVTETGYRPQYGSGQPAYGQAEYSRTNLAGGGQRQEYQRYEQDDERSGYGERITQQSRPTYGGGFERTTETRYEQPGGVWESEVVREGRESSGRTYRENYEYEGRDGFNRDSERDTSYERTTGRFDADQRENYGRTEEYSNREEFGERQHYGREYTSDRFGRGQDFEETETFEEDRRYDRGDRGYGEVDESEERRDYDDEYGSRRY